MTWSFLCHLCKSCRGHYEFCEFSKHYGYQVDKGVIR